MWNGRITAVGFDVFAMDMTGYGKSSRPKMDDPCNVRPAEQKALIPKTLPAACKPTYPYELVNSQSESDDIDRVVLRAPTRTYWGWNAETAKKLKQPTLILVGEYDQLTASNKELYEDLGSANKVFVAISCASHFVLWEKQHGPLHRASGEWLAKGTFNGAARGMFRIDPQGRFVAN